MSPARAVFLVLLLVACSSEPPGVSPGPPASPATPTTIVIVVTVPPIPTAAPPTRVPSPVIPTAAAGPEQAQQMTSDGISTPPSFRLAGGDYVLAWEVPRPTVRGGCSFGAVLTSEPSVAPFTLQTLGPWTVEPTSGYSGSKWIDGLSTGSYTLRPSGDCPWTVTVTPMPGR